MKKNWVKPHKWIIGVFGICLILSGCNNNNIPRPRITFEPEIVQNRNVIIGAQVDPNGTSVTEIRIEWGRRPTSVSPVTVPGTEFFENNALKDTATSNTIQLPATRPFRGQFNFRFPSAGQPLSEGNIVDYQIRVTHTTPSGTLFFWSQRQHFTYHQADVPAGGGVPPPPLLGGGGGANGCSHSTEWISIHTGNGSIANPGGSKAPAISGDGQIVAFSTPIGFDPNDTNNADDVYLHDMGSNSTEWVSIHTGGGSISNNGGSKDPSVSEDGQVIAFVTPVGFDPNDTNNADDVYIHDRQANETQWVSIHTGSGSIANNGGSDSPSISADGQRIVFSTPVGFDPNDSNSAQDVYIHCR